MENTSAKTCPLLTFKRTFADSSEQVKQPIWREDFEKGEAFCAHVCAPRLRAFYLCSLRRCNDVTSRNLEPGSETKLVPSFGDCGSDSKWCFSSERFASALDFPLTSMQNLSHFHVSMASNATLFAQTAGAHFRRWTWSCEIMKRIFLTHKTNQACQQLCVKKFVKICTLQSEVSVRRFRELFPFVHKSCWRHSGAERGLRRDAPRCKGRWILLYFPAASLTRVIPLIITIHSVETETRISTAFRGLGRIMTQE